MRKFLGVAVLCGLLASLVGTGRAGDPPDPRAIVDKAIKAMGGEEKLTKFKAMSWKEKGTYYGMGDGLPYTGNYSVQWPGQFRMEVEGVFTSGLDGDKGWIKSGDKTKEMTKEELAENKDHQYSGWVTSLRPLKDKSFTLKSLGSVKIDGRPAAKVNVSSKGHRDITLFFDTGNGLLVRSQTMIKSKDKEGKLVDQVADYSGYKAVQGVQVPTKISIKQDGKLFVEAEMTDIKLHEKLDQKVFAQP
jgi:hypothetical protein